MEGTQRPRLGTRLILLDTHVLLWLRSGGQQLGRQALNAVDHAWAAGDVAVSAITFWEAAMLNDKGRIRLSQDIRSWRRGNLRQGLIEIRVDGEIGIRAGALNGLPGDPADRIIVATALEGHRLVTADRRILDWHGPLQKLDATQ